MASETPGPLATWRLACFAAPQIPLAALGVPITTYLPPYYATELGLGLTAVGLIFMITKFWDIGTDPVLGMISDKLQTRFGRRRHWMVISVPILLVSGYLVFFPESVLSGDASRTYLLGSLILLYIGYTFLTISHMSWGAELSTVYHERSRIQGAIQLFALVGMFLVLAPPAVIEQTGGTASDRDKVAAMGWFLIVLLPIAVAASVLSVGERPSAPDSHIGPRRALAILARNKLMLRIVFADLMVALPGGIRGSMYVFFMLQVIGTPEWISLIMLSYFLSGPIAVPLWLRISRRMGKHRAMAWGVFLHVVVTLGYLLPGQGDWWLFALLFFLSGVVYAGTPFLLRAIVADVAEADTLESGQQRTGLYYALVTMTSKLGHALGIGIGYPVLAWIGFSPDGENTQAAINGLRYLYVFIPVFSELLVVSLIYRFPLDEVRQRFVRSELDARSAHRA